MGDTRGTLFCGSVTCIRPKRVCWN